MTTEPSRPTLEPRDLYVLPSPGVSFTVTQTFSYPALTYLWSTRATLGLDPGQLASLQALYDNRKDIPGSDACTQRITYSLKKPAGGFGRFYGTKGSLETLEKSCRGTLCNHYYRDIDIVNCHPVLCVQFARRFFGFRLKHLKHYVKNREECLSAFTTREEGKDAYIRMMYGGNAPCPELEPFAAELQGFARYLMTLAHFAALRAYSEYKVKNERRKNDKSHSRNLVGVFLSHVLQAEEVRCAQALMRNARDQGFSPDIYSYDGCQVRVPSLDASGPDLVQMELAILAGTGYSVNLVEKAMTVLPIPFLTDERIRGVPETNYQVMKARFEENHFYYKPTNMFVEINADGAIQWMDRRHAEACLAIDWYFPGTKRSEVKEFFPIWWEKDRQALRYITSINLQPSTDPHSYSPPLNLAYMNDSVVTDERRAFLEKRFMECLLVVLKAFKHQSVLANRFQTERIPLILRNGYVRKPQRFNEKSVKTEKLMTELERNLGFVHSFKHRAVNIFNLLAIKVVHG